MKVFLKKDRIDWIGFFEKVDYEKYSLREKGALIYHKSGIARSPRENDFALLLKKSKMKEESPIAIYHFSMKIITRGK